MDSNSQKQIEDLTRQLEHGDASKVAPFMQGKFEEERIEALQMIRQQNQLHRQQDEKVPELAISYGSMIPSSNYERIELMSGAWSYFAGGKQLYSSYLDIQKLTRGSGSDEPVPPSRFAIDTRSLTNQLEKGVGRGLKDVLDPLKEEERVRVFQDVSRLNKEDLSQHKTNVELQISIAATKTGSDYIDVTRVLPGFHDAFFGGVQIYHEILDLHTLQRNAWESTDKRK